MDVNVMTLTCFVVTVPEMKYTPSGKTITVFRVGSIGYKDNKFYIDVECWDTTAEKASKFKKGTSLCLMGRLANDNWEKDGKKQSKIKFVVSDYNFVRVEREKQQNGKSEPTTV